MRRLANVILYVPLIMIACLCYCFACYYLFNDFYNQMYPALNAVFGNSLILCLTLYLVTLKFKVCRHSKSALATMSLVAIFNFLDTLFNVVTLYYYPIICLIIYTGGLLVSLSYLFKDFGNDN